MGTPIFVEALGQPLTCSTCILLVVVWAWLSHRRLGYVDCGFNFDQVVGHQQYWRLLTSTFSHIDIVHLLFNTTGLWSLGYAEVLLGSRQWATTTVLLVVTTNTVSMALYSIGVKLFKREQLARIYCVGFSGVLFGWMAVLSVRNPGGLGRLSLFGLVNVPLFLAPFGSLILTTLLIPHASFIGHLAGILAGYTIALTALDTTLGLAIVLLWLAVGVVWTIVQQEWKCPQWFITYRHQPADLESGAASLAVRLISPLTPTCDAR